MPRTFVYGTFLWPFMFTKPVPKPTPLPPPPRLYKIDSVMAIEILREFGASELVGKLYGRPIDGSWSPVQLTELEWLPWYRVYVDSGKVVFDMDASGAWEVLFVRRESDEQGAYVAVALRLPQKEISWLQQTRRNLQRTKGL
jgi:hypothetical protein